ncbi:DUF6263 family protein [Pedobacter aquatilis]|uniref:DUF6263 family protein n=1 Tax=Pedobacter aquatilis TaxID=351343 RepID=UPI0025B2CB07|nr:DUF6263 family protein [Pedobacter aquatilis]MDN3587682.1 DUF6263 family protein [Pedobacter aquatilis]
MKLITTITCFLITASTFAQKTYLLKQAFPVGKKYAYSINSDQIISQKADGKESNYIQNIGTDYTFEIAEVKALDKNIKVVYNRVKIKSAGMGNELILDSDTEEAGKPNPFAGLKNASFNMLISSDGSIKSVSGVDKMVNDMVTKITTDTAQIRAVKASLAKQFNADVIKQTMESALKIFPQKSVKIGDSWTISSKVNITMPIESIVTYTLKEVKGNVAVLSIKGNLLSKGGFESLGTKMQTDLKGLNMGDAQVDLTTGMILNSHTRLELYGKMNAAGSVSDFELEGITKITGKEIN